MTVIFALAVSLLPLGDVPAGTCVARTALTDLQPQGFGQTFQARHTIFGRDFALTKWYYRENGGGEILWRRRDARWCAVPTQNVYLDEPAMVHRGVPAAEARTFRYERAAYLQAIVTFRRREPSAKDPEAKD
jgi:hypothetical protein